MLKARNIHGQRNLQAENSEGKAEKLASHLDTLILRELFINLKKKPPRARSFRPHPTHTLFNIFPTYSEELPQALISEIGG